MENKKIAVIYARYSSDNQRSESIDAQIRAIKEYARRKEYEIVGTYIDRAKSGTTDKRPEFLRMIKDSCRGDFNIVLVHKLDRFSRDKYDAVTYKRKLQKNGARVESVMEQLDNSPESIILESVLEGMAQYYSKNLARECMKGLKETALQCKHTGGSPPLGYDVDKETRHYIINEHEAKAVKVIFEKYLENFTIPAIIKELNEFGYKTKKGEDFGLNSVRSILKNEKYCGVFVFNKSASKDAFGRRNGNKAKDDKDIIRIKGGMPSIVTEDQYQRTQALMETRRNGNQGKQKAKEIYLLSGIIKCSCGHAMYGNRRKPKGKPLYVSYRCGARHKKGAASECKTPEIRKEYIEDFVLTELENYFVNDQTASTIVKSVNNYVDKLNIANSEKLEHLNKELSKIQKQIGNIMSAIMQGFIQEEFKTQLEELKIEKTSLELEKGKYTEKLERPEVKAEEIREKLIYLKEYVKTRNLPECRKLIKDFVKEVKVYEDRVEVKLNTASFVFKGLESGENIKKKRKDLYVKNSHTNYHSFLRRKGYDYSREVSLYGNIK
jgi:site-specific DNA recombinase